MTLHFTSLCYLQLTSLPFAFHRLHFPSLILLRSLSPFHFTSLFFTYPINPSLHFTCFFTYPINTSLHFAILNYNSLPLNSLPFTFYHLHFPSLVLLKKLSPFHFTFFHLPNQPFISLHFAIHIYNSLPLTSLPFTFYRLHFPSLVFTFVTLVLKIRVLP